MPLSRKVLIEVFLNFIGICLFMYFVCIMHGKKQVIALPYLYDYCKVFSINKYILYLAIALSLIFHSIFYNTLWVFHNISILPQKSGSSFHWYWKHGKLNLPAVLHSNHCTTIFFCLILLYMLSFLPKGSTRIMPKTMMKTM